MDNKSVTQLNAGVYVVGKPLSNVATLIKRKDGTGVFVKVSTEISTRPGAPLVETLYDPAKDPSVKVEGEKITAFPALPEDQLVVLRADPSGISDYKGKIRFGRVERLA